MTNHGSAHLATISRLKAERSPKKLKDSDSQREETNDGNESDYSDPSEADYDDNNFAFGEGDDSDVDEDEAAMAVSDPKSDRVMVLPSLFAGRPASVWFDYAVFAQRTREAGRERIVELTDEKLNPCLFRSNHTIVCLGGALKRSGFRRLLKGNTFNVFWGQHLKEAQLQKLHPQQYVNHFPGSYTLGRKDYLWKNIQRQQRQHPAAYDFSAKSYVLPRDRELLQKDYEEVRPRAIRSARAVQRDARAASRAWLRRRTRAQRPRADGSSALSAWVCRAKCTL
jgi:hypothetical protein